MGDMERTISGEYPLCNNPGCARAFTDHDRRIRDLEQDETISRLQVTLTAIQADLAGLKGRIAGWQFAGTMLGAVVGAMAAALVAVLMRGGR